MRSIVVTAVGAFALVVSFAALAACQWGEFCTQDTFGSDYRVYSLALDSAWHGRDPYLPHSIGWGYFYPPPALLFLKSVDALSRIGLAPTPTFSVLSVVAVSLCLAILARRMNWRAAFVALLLLISAGMLESTCIGQINGLVVLLIGSFFWAWRRRFHWLACAALATAICLKVTPVVLAAFYVTRDGWRWLPRLAALVVTWFLAAHLLIPTPHLTASFVEALRWAASAPVDTTATFNYSFSAGIPLLLTHFGSVAGGASTVVYWGVVLLLGLLFGAAYIRYLLGLRAAANAFFVSSCVCMVCAPHIVWLHHATLLIPAFFMLLVEPTHRFVSATALLALLSFQSTRCLQFGLHVHPALPFGIGQALLVAACAAYVFTAADGDGPSTSSGS